MKLRVNHDGIDYTKKMDSFTNAVTAFNMTTVPLYIGFHKPLKKIYVEMESRVEDCELAISVWDGSVWSLITTGVEDYTYGLTQSGYISWPEDTDQELKNLGDGAGEIYWVKITISSNPAAISINGINITLSTDNDLSFVPGITQFLPTNYTSFIAFHQEARDMIVQMLRNSGKKISQYNSDDAIDTRQVDQFDLLDIEEFRNASKYLALHLIFDHLSKSDEDAYFQKSKRFYERFMESYNSNLISIDTNDNGQTDEDENQSVQFIRIRRE